MLRLVLDTGVFVAAAITPDGVCGRLLRLLIAGGWPIFASPKLLAELEGVLSRDKFRRWLSSEEARRFVAGIAGIAETRPDPPAELGLTPDPDDDYLFALARASAADY